MLFSVCGLEENSLNNRITWRTEVAAARDPTAAVGPAGPVSIQDDLASAAGIGRMRFILGIPAGAEKH
jgi:hypothetical protein